jgi:hypothetical protein
VRYAVPRNVDEPDRLIPFFTTRQLVSTLAAGVLAAWLFSATAGRLPDELRWMLALWLPLLGLVATRRLGFPARARRKWETWQLVLAWGRYCLRPRRTVWKGGHR